MNTPTPNPFLITVAVRVIAALFIALTFPAAAVDYPTNGLVFYWRLDEGTGLVANDSSGNGNHGTFVGFPGDDSQWITGYTNTGVHFNPGVTGNVASAMAIVSPNIGTSTSTTWAVWVRMNLNDTNGFANVMSGPTGAGAGHNLGFDTTGRFPRLLWNNGATPSTTIASPEPITSEWTHLAVTWNAANSNLTLFVNGAAKANSTTAGGRTFNTIHVGRRGNQQFAWRDDLDEIFVYNRALTPIEIAALAGVPAGPPQVISPPKSLVVWQGETAQFNVQASGTPPPTYQWLRDGVPIAGATDTSYSIANAQSTNAGAFQVVVSNSAGTITSTPPAMLAIRPLTNIPPSLPSWIIPSGLVLYWNMDETTNYAAWDYSGNQHHGALFGFPFDGSQQSEGFIVNGLQLFPPNFNQYGEAHGLPLLTNTTWAAWVKLLQPIGAATVLSATFPGAANGHNFGFDNTPTTQRHPRILWNSGVMQSIAVSPEPIDDEWNHIAMTYDVAAQQLKLFVNGVEKAAQAATSTGFTNIVMGRRATTGMQQFGGLIDEVTIYDRALSNAEIESMFTNSLAQGELPFRYLRLLIEDISVTNQNELAIVLRTLWPDQPHKLEGRPSVTDGAWTEITGVTFEVLTNSRVRATFPLPAENLVIRAQVTTPAPIFADDFETGGPGWTHGGPNENWELGIPTSEPDTAHSGTNVYATGLSDNYNPEADGYLRSPAINLTGYTNGVTLTFWEYRDIYPNLNFHRGIVNIIDADTFAVLGEVFRVAGSSGGWAERTLAMPAAAYGKNVRIEFRLQSDPFDVRPGWAIDDVSVQK
ncbi:MAG TPA: LamG-like jellyroll fold domain-containing protein [Verrucomicrobiae bacterium]|nr:LamG-like jellyroll fold domain-containing protein [Verrucomicrobiae bacterium]